MASTLDVSVQPALLDVQPGAQASAQVTISNKGQFVGQYQLALAGFDASAVVIEPDQLGIFPGGSATATVRVRPAAGVSPATYPTVIRVVNQNDPSDESRALLKVNVLAAAPGSVRPAAVGMPPPGIPEAGMESARVPSTPPESRPTTTTASQATTPLTPFTSTPARRGVSPGAGQLECAIDRDSLSVLPGSRVVLNMLVRNNGGTPLAVELAIEGLPPAWTTLQPMSVDLPASQAAGGRLTLTVPPDAPTGSYPIVLMATDRDNPAGVVQLALVVEIGEAGGVSLELDPPRAEGQASAEYTVRITQSGSAALNVSLTASDPDDGATYTFNQAAVYVPAGGRGESRLSVRARRGLIGVDSRTYSFTVSATPAEGTTGAATIDGAFVQRRTPPIALTLSTAEQSAADQAIYDVHVANASQVETTVKLAAADIDGGCRYQFSTSTLVLPPGGEGQSKLTVTPMQLSTAPTPIIHNFTIRAEPSGELLSSAQVDGKYIQTAMVLPTVAVTPQSQSTTGAATYTVQVTNRRPAAVDVELRAFDAANIVDLTLNPSTLHVPASGSARARLVARPTAALLAGEGRRPNEFTVEARVAGLPDAAAANGTLVQVSGANLARFVPWILGLLLLLCLCGALSFIIPGVSSFAGRQLGQAQTLVASAPTTPPLSLFGTFTPTPTPTSTPAPTSTPVPPSVTPDLGPFAIKGLTAKVSPASASACPATFNFSADITVNRAGSVTYVWEFSNGISTPPKTINFSGPGSQTVTASATFNQNGPGGGHVKVTSPPSPDSNQATVVLNCPSAPTAAPGGATPTPTHAPGPPTLPPAILSFAGAWVHNFGTMNLTQSGPNVTGTYFNAFANQTGTIAGTVSGNVLNGTWHIGSDTGTVKWTVAPGDQTFTGTWNSAVLWCGARAGTPLPSGCGFAGSWNIRLEGGTRTMALTQTGTSVSGTYFNGTQNGTVSGNVSFTGGLVVLAGTWTVSGGSGPFHFYISDFPSDRFQGNYNTTFEWCGWRGGATQPSPCLK